MSLRGAMYMSLNTAPAAALTLDLSGVSSTGTTLNWLDTSDLTDVVLSGSSIVTLPNKGTLGGNWTSSNPVGSGLPELATDTPGNAHILFNVHGARLQVGTAADAKFLHDGTQYLVVALAATNGNGGPLYSTAPSDVTGVGTFLHAGFWGSSWQNTLIKAWKNPALSWMAPLTAADAMPGTAPPTYRIVSSTMRGYGVSSGNKWEALINGATTPLTDNYSNALDSHLSGTESTNPYQALSVGHFANSEPSYYGLQLKQLVVRKYPAATAVSIIEADRAYIRNQINAFYSIY